MQKCPMAVESRENTENYKLSPASFCQRLWLLVQVADTDPPLATAASEAGRCLVNDAARRLLRTCTKLGRLLAAAGALALALTRLVQQLLMRRHAGPQFLEPVAQLFTFAGLVLGGLPKLLTQLLAVHLRRAGERAFECWLSRSVFFRFSPSSR